MDDLTYTLRQLCQRNRDGSHATQADRQRSLGLAARQLREASWLKGKHVEALLQRWQAESLSAGTLKNRPTHLRWWAEKIGKAGILPGNNTRLGIPERHPIAGENKAKELDDKLDRITDPHVRMRLRLQGAFGLRREESIKFQPGYADRGDHIALKSSWTKGGRERTVLDDVHRLAGADSLIPAHKTYIQQRHAYDGQCKAAGLSNMHGLQHRYAQARYEAPTGWKAPAAGGPHAKTLTPAQHNLDTQARQTISRELGRERNQITAVYLGR